MAVTQARDLTVAKSDVAAEMVAAAVWQSATDLVGNSPVVESARRLLRRHAHELLELHSIKPGDVLSTVAAMSENGRVRLDVEPDHHRMPVTEG
jgi:hypothetical protein